MKKLHDLIYGREYDEALEMLNDKSVNLEELNEDGMTALQVAIGDHFEEPAPLDFIKALIDAGADVNASGDDNSALKIASYNGRVDVIRLLVENGADMYAETNHTVDIAWAVYQQHYDAVKTMLELGYDINHQDSTGMTLLHYAMVNIQHDMIDFVMNMVDGNGNRINPFLKSKDGSTALDYYIDEMKIEYPPLVDYMKKLDVVAHETWLEDREIHDGLKFKIADGEWREEDDRIIFSITYNDDCHDLIDLSCKDTITTELLNRLSNIRFVWLEKSNIFKIL